MVAGHGKGRAPGRSVLRRVLQKGGRGGLSGMPRVSSDLSRDASGFRGQVTPEDLEAGRLERGEERVAAVLDGRQA